MIKPQCFQRTILLANLFLICSLPNTVLAQNKVVVIPMAGDSVVQEIDTFDRTIIVGGSGSAAENGQAVLTALDQISSPSTSNRWVIWLEPGQFDVGSAGIILPDYVSLRGSGMGVSIVYSAGTASHHRAIDLAGNNTLSDLTIEDSSSGSSSGAVVPSGDNVIIQNIQVLTDDEDGIRIHNDTENVLVNNAIVNAGDRALSAQGSNNDIMVRNSALASNTDNTVNVGTNSVVLIESSTIDNTSTNKPVLNIFNDSELTIRHSSISATSIDTSGDLVNNATTSTSVLLMYHNHINVSTSFDFGAGASLCYAITTPKGFLADSYCFPGMSS
ncbi:right-handed parallel beta-helix repeat-containing protein [Arenicella xantha]|uniref:Right handed beta helix domain-containing protein n=1 Tax=Arenicella xantha TaxID=644221 RepID=A0A395JW50_9GAMM|nr:right-handed parallel beta-helix repeat-containing protein [Arenicella xantha]RBP53778.1 hypothetical protein DFR28_1011167 [Arenicella xantha]